MLSLKQLDSLFETLWLLPNQLPNALAQWQGLLADYLADPAERSLLEQQKLASMMAKWQKGLAENKQLFEAHQEDLVEHLKAGEVSFLSSTQIKQFNN
ncbi:hypothetical protein [Reinekea sp.]|uniref:hypothetical protein n=1 Tax=Reinekea sp. TaxID=1970455 RepID=UPI002A828340|nr:hypothetical protein [Reinekea sp.]